MIPEFFRGQIYWFEPWYHLIFRICVCCMFVNTKTVQLQIYYLITCFIICLCYTGNSRNASDVHIYRMEWFFIWFTNGHRCRPMPNSVAGHHKRSPNINTIKNMWREVKRTRQETWSVLPPRNSDALGSLYQKLGMKLLHLSITFNHRLSPCQDECNQWLKERSSGLLIREISSWKQPS
jgi:hypothetical protein